MSLGTAEAAMLRSGQDIIRFLGEFRKLAPEIEVQTILIFMIVAQSPGIRLKALERAAGLSSSADSRNVLALSGRSYIRDPATKEFGDGLGLVVTATDPFDVRAKVVSVTPRGRKLFKTICEIFSPSGTVSGPSSP